MLADIDPDASPPRPSARSTARRRGTAPTSRSRCSTPGIAEAVDSDLRNLRLLSRCCALAPGLDTEALADELRDRVSEELDYELEAQSTAGSPAAGATTRTSSSPRVDTELSTRRVLVTEFVDGAASRAVKASPDAERDRIGEIVHRFYYATARRAGPRARRPAPGQLPARHRRARGLLDFGMLRQMPAGYLEREAALPGAATGTAPGCARSGELGYLPEPWPFDDELLFATCT